VWASPTLKEHSTIGLQVRGHQRRFGSVKPIAQSRQIRELSLEICSISSWKLAAIGYRRRRQWMIVLALARGLRRGTAETKPLRGNFMGRANGHTTIVLERRKKKHRGRA